MVKNGHDYQREEALKVLSLDETYTVKSIEVGSWMSYVELEEFPGQSFNTVMFTNI